MLVFEGVQDKSACWSICLEISRGTKAPFTLACGLGISPACLAPCAIEARIDTRDA